MNPLALLQLIPGFSFLRLGVVAVVLVALAAGVWKIRHDGAVAGRAEVQASWDAERAATAEQTRALLMARDKTNDALQAVADTTRRSLNEHVQSIDLELAESLKRLRSRSTRSADGSVPADPGPRGGGTGAGLFAEDGEFLAREAARADKLRAALTSCQNQYRAAQDAVNPKP